jgi:hypothetical protein
MLQAADIVVLVVVAVAQRRLGPSSSASISTTEWALPSSAVLARCWSRPTITTRLPLVRDSATCSAWSRHTILVKTVWPGGLPCPWNRGTVDTVACPHRPARPSTPGVMGERGSRREGRSPAHSARRRAATGQSRWPLADANPGWPEPDLAGRLHRVGTAIATKVPDDRGAPIGRPRTHEGDGNDRGPPTSRRAKRRGRGCHSDPSFPGELS